MLMNLTNAIVLRCYKIYLFFPGGEFVNKKNNLIVHDEVSSPQCVELILQFIVNYTELYKSMNFEKTNSK